MSPLPPRPPLPDREFLLRYERLYGEWLRADQAAAAAERDASSSALQLRQQALDKLAELLQAVRSSPL